MNDKQIKALRKKVKRLEDNNQHNDVAIAVTRAFGTVNEVASLGQIKARHLFRGHIEAFEIDERSRISSKYYKLLFSDSIETIYEQAVEQFGITLSKLK